MTELPLRRDLVGQHPYGAPTDDVAVRLNVNENPYPPPPDVVADITSSIAGELTRINRYPDREAVDLRRALAAYIGAGVTADQVWAANGSNEVMHQILGAFGGPGRTLVSFTPTYSMYPVYARDTNTAYTTATRSVDHSIDPRAAEDIITATRASVVVVASPNNPTGGLLDLDQIRHLHSLAAPHGVLVVDEAYIEFEPGAGSAVELLGDSPRLVVLRTMSKAWGLAGLRVGYAVTSPAIVDALRLVRLPYHLSALTQAAAVAALGHADTLLAPVADVVAERRIMQQWLVDHGIPAAASNANFILIGPLRDSTGLFTALRERGVLVRETGGPGHLRVSIGTESENEALRQALLDIHAPLDSEGRP